MAGLTRPLMPMPKHYIFRSDGTMTPLIAVDELPASTRLKYVPRKLSLAQSQGLQSLGVEPKSAGTYEVEVVGVPGTAKFDADDGSSDLTERAVSVLATIPEQGPAVVHTTSTPHVKAQEHAVEGWRRSVARVETGTSKADLAPSANATAISKDQNSAASTVHPGSRRSFVTGISLESQPYKPAQPGIFGSKQYCTHWIRKGYRCYPRWFREASQMTGENRELFGREPGPDPMPLPIPQPIPMPANQHPTPLPVPQPIPGPSRAGTQQASSPFDKLRNGHQDPMYGPGGPRSLFTTSSVGGGRNRNDGNNRFRGGPSRRGRHHQSWHNHSPSLFGAQPPPNGGRTPQRQMTSATAIPIRKGQNSAPAPKSGGIDEPSSPSVAASTPSAKEPMRMESLVERFSNRATPQQVSTPLSTSGPQPVLNQASTTPALGLMQSMHSGPALASTNGVTQSTHSPAPISQTTPSKIPKVAQSKPASERHTPAKPVALKSMRHFLPLIPTPQAPRAPGTTAPAPAASAPAAPAPVAPTTSHSQEAPPIRDLYDGIPKIPEPVIPRRFVSIEQPSTYVAPDATVKDESTEVNKKGQNEQHHSPQIVTKILQREKKPAEVSGQDENAAAAPTTPARRSTTRDVRLEDPAQLEAEFSRRGTWAANNQPSSRRTNGRAFRRVRNGSEYLLDLDAE